MAKIKLFKSEVRKVADLIPYIHNPLDHPDDQVDIIAGSMKEYGFDQDIIIDEENEIIAGHGRLLAAKKLGMEEITVKVQKLSEVKKRGRRMVDNKAREKAQANIENEALELSFLKDAGVDIEGLGYELAEVDFILNGVQFVPVSEDEQPQLDEKKKTECPNCGHQF